MYRLKIVSSKGLKGFNSRLCHTVSLYCLSLSLSSLQNVHVSEVYVKFVYLNCELILDRNKLISHEVEACFIEALW